MIAVVEYGAGNLTSVRKGLSAAGATFFTPEAPDELRRASGIVVPGVGHFAAAEPLQHGWMDAIRTAIASGTPLLGICLGLQWLFEGSDEAPNVGGLGLLPGRCHHLGSLEFGVGSLEFGVGSLEFGVGSSRGRTLVKVPHVGWNTLQRLRPSRLLAGVQDDAFAYFTHSYAAPVTEASVATTRHGAEFASVVEHGNVFGVQFHPEKSGDAGVRILRNFVAVTA